MIILSTKELYLLFLGSTWWITLSRLKRKRVRKCERCGSKKYLQSHHKLYRENWFDTVLSDLEVLCRKCHCAHHNKKPPVMSRRRKNKKYPWVKGKKITLAKPLKYWQTFNTSRKPNYVNRGSSTN